MNAIHRVALLIGIVAGGSISAHAQTAQPSAIEPLTAGTKAPAFRLEDQFGTQQSKETLKGKNGTILLFFRSADW